MLPKRSGCMNLLALVARKKRNSSIWIGTNLVKSGDAQAVVSAGNTGAYQWWPHFFYWVPFREWNARLSRRACQLEKGMAVMLDVGATVDCTAKQLYQFGDHGV